MLTYDNTIWFVAHVKGYTIVTRNFFFFYSKVCIYFIYFKNVDGLKKLLFIVYFALKNIKNPSVKD